MYILKSEYSIKMEQCLNKDTLKIAKEELREDEATRDNALSQMRLWLKQNKKIIYSRSGKYYFIFHYLCISYKLNINIKIFSNYGLSTS